VTQALINYYFDSKEQLFTEVYLRRSRQIVERRMEALEQLYKSGKPFSLEELLSAFLDPAFAMRRTRAGRAFIRLQSRVHTEPPPFVKRLRRQVFDESTRAFVAAIQEVVPHISEKTAYWRIILVIGAYAYVYSDAHRLEEISKGICNSDDFAEMLAQTKAFVIGGIRAPSADKAPLRHSEVDRRPESGRRQAIMK
jgi:AcrR family transcriptional regulator